VGKETKAMDQILAIKPEDLLICLAKDHLSTLGALLLLEKYHLGILIQLESSPSFQSLMMAFF
jgi:hypothetical protein